VRDRPLERRLVLPDEPGHAAELFNSPRVAPRLARGELAVLSLEKVLEQIHDRTSIRLTHPAGRREQQGRSS
jgi:hypothetical protein